MPRVVASCEWMFGDAATGVFGISSLAHLNPMRWSGAISFPKAIADLEGTIKHGKGDRAIIIKVPANSGKENERKFNSAQEAIDHLKSEDPISKVGQAAAEGATVAEKDFADATERLEVLEESVEMHSQEVAEAKSFAETKANECSAAEKKNDEALAEKEKVEAGTDVATGGYGVGASASKVELEWMFASAGAHSFGFKLAHMDPMRWSGKICGVKAINQLNELKKHDTEKPILFSQLGVEHECDTVDHAIEYVESLYPEIVAAKEAHHAAAQAVLAAAGARENVEAAEDRMKWLNDQIEKCKEDVAAKKALLE